MEQNHCHEPDGVRSLRVAHGVSLEAIARHCSLSVKQLQQIEEGGSDAFYSPAIKQQALNKVMQALKRPDSLQALQKAMLRDAQMPLHQHRQLSIKHKASYPARLG